MLKIDSFVSSVKTTNGFDCMLGEERLQFNEDLSEIKVEEKHLNQVMDACFGFMDLCDAIESAGGMDAAVLCFVNHNQELSAVLGIDLATEDVKQIEDKTEEKKPGILRRAWEAIKKFFKMIWKYLKRAWLHFSDLFIKMKDNAPLISRHAEEIVEKAEKIEPIQLSKGDLTAAEFKQQVAKFSNSSLDSAINQVMEFCKNIVTMPEDQLVSKMSEYQQMYDVTAKTYADAGILHLYPFALGSALKVGDATFRFMEVICNTKFKDASKMSIGKLKAGGWFELENLRGFEQLSNTCKASHDKLEKVIKGLEAIISQYESCSDFNRPGIFVARAFSKLLREYLASVCFMFGAIFSINCKLYAVYSSK